MLSYNILADYLANSHRKLYFHIPRRFMSWDWRKGNILFELRLWSPDIMCLQVTSLSSDVCLLASCLAIVFHDGMLVFPPLKDLHVFSYDSSIWFENSP